MKLFALAWIVFGVGACSPLTVLKICHRGNPYLCDPEPVEGDPTKVTMSIDCVDARLNEIERLHKAANR